MGVQARARAARRVTGLKGEALKAFARLEPEQQIQVQIAKSRLAGASLGDAHAAAVMNMSQKEWRAFCKRLQFHELYNRGRVPTPR
jgi:hypothetical protein